jgi:hypothetical protein
MKRTVDNIGKTTENFTSYTDKNYDINGIDNTNSVSTDNIVNTQIATQNRNNKINVLIDKMNGVIQDNEGSNLANFNPPNSPILQNKREFNPTDLLPKYNANISDELNNAKNGNDYKPNASDQYNGNNYNYIYSNKLLYNQTQKPKEVDINNQLLDKLNYMIHLLEQNQAEKTDNITEEFILYSFLGIFIIFVVDSFSKTKKYIR